MRQWIGIAAVLFGFVATGSVEAQPQPLTDEQFEQLQQRIEELHERLNLSPEQTEAMETIAVELWTATEAVLRSHGIEPSEPWPSLNTETLRGLGEALAELNEQNQAALAEILTAEQLDEYQAAAESFWPEGLGPDPR